MRLVSCKEAELWVNLPELRRFQRGPIDYGDEWVSLAHRADDTVFIEHDDVLGMFHPAPLDGVFFCHHAVPKERWGPRGRAAASEIILAAWDGYRVEPVRFIAWTMRSNSLSVNFAERLGFVIDGFFPHGDDVVVQLGAVRCHLAAAQT